MPPRPVSQNAPHFVDLDLLPAGGNDFDKVARLFYWRLGFAETAGGKQDRRPPRNRKTLASGRWHLGPLRRYAPRCVSEYLPEEVLLGGVHQEVDHTAATELPGNTSVVIKNANTKFGPWCCYIKSCYCFG